MDLDKEIMRRLKIEVAALEAAMSQKDARLLRLENERNSLLIPVVLKFGTMTAPQTMEMVVPMGSFGMTSVYAVDIIDQPKSNERIIRVRRVLNADYHHQG